MKKLLYTLFLQQLFTFCANAQKPEKISTDLSPSKKIRSIFITLKPGDKKTAFSLPFSSIAVQDARPDTSKYGFSRKVSRRSVFQYRSAKGIEPEIKHYLNTRYHKSFDSTSANRLLLVLKKLWISSFDSLELVYTKYARTHDLLYFKADVFFQSGEAWYPVFRYDTVLVLPLKYKSEPDLYIQQALDLFFEKLQPVNFNLIQNRKFVTRDYIDSTYAVTWQLPIHQADKPAKGVYITYEDFKNNRPSYTDYEVKFERIGDNLYVKEEDGKYYYRNKVWGFCNGEDIFIKMGLNYFPLFRSQHTWEFYGTNQLRTVDGSLPVFIGPTVPLSFTLFTAGTDAFRFENKLLGKLRPFQVDPETGKFY